MKPALRLLFVFVAGGVAALGFAPWEWWLLTVAGVGALIWLNDRSETRRGAFALGWLFGVGHHLVGLSWIATAFTYQAAMPAWLGWVAVGGLSMFLALYTGAAALVARAAPPGPARVMLFAAAWMLGEWLRGHLLSGFAWNPLGEAWLPVAGIPQAAAYVGALGLSGLMILAGGAAALAFTRARAGATAAIAAALVIVGYVVAAPSPPIPMGAPIVHLVQPDIGQGDKWNPAVEAAHLERYIALSRDGFRRSRRLPEAWDRSSPTPPAPARAPQIVIWSESAVPQIVEEDAGARTRLAALLSRGDMLIFGGVALIRDARGEVIAATNSLYTIDADAKLHGRYDKAHLVPLGEYVPARPLMEWLGLARLAPGAFDFRPGPGPRTLPLPGFPAFGAQICYEMIFPGEVVQTGTRPAWLVNISNDAWFGPTGPPQHLAQARLRAIEEGLPVARATPTGISAMIDARGRITRSVAQGSVGVATAPLPPPLPPTWFARWAHWTTFAFGLLLIAAALAISYRLRRAEIVA